MADSTRTELKSVAWFAASAPKAKGALPGVAQLLVCIVASLLLHFAHRTAMAIVVLALGALIFLICLIWPAARSSIERIMASFARGVAQVIGFLLLTAAYLFVMTPLRVIGALTGKDELHLRDKNRTSFWLPSDADARKTRYVSTMFATEAPVRRGRPWLTVLITVVLLLLMAEGLLRLMHYGEPLTYVADPLIGYYPAPNKTLSRGGSLIHTNQFGMRSSDIQEKKPDGVFRILMLGDSTQYGGSYVTQSDLYSSLLQEQLNRRNLRGKVEILAIGANGWGPFHERGYVEHFGSFGADLAIINLPIDDVNRPLYGLMDVPFFSVQAPPHLALEQVANHFIWRYRSRHAGLDAKWEAQQSQIGIREYGSLVDDLQKLGAEVIVAVLPTRAAGTGGPEDETEKKWRLQLEQTVNARGVRMLFAAGWFADKGTQDEIYHDYVHLQPTGHRAYADYLEAHIASDSERFKRFAAKESR